MSWHSIVFCLHFIKIPIEVMALAPTVRTIDVSKNELVVLPVALQNFIELKQLNVEHNIIGM